MLRRSRNLGWLALLVCVGCHRVAPDVEVETTGAAIVGGSADPGDANVVDLVWLMTDGTFVECSGSLLAPNLVLTAHHCVAPVEGPASIQCSTASFGATVDPGELYVSTAEERPMGTSAYHRARAVMVPPGSTGTAYCGVDQALVILDDEIAPSEAVPLVPRVDAEVVMGEPYTAIGFGVTSYGGMDAGTRRKLTGLTAKCAGASCASLGSGVIDATREWGGQSGTCDGDSGGPALDAKGRVIGVTSRGATGCVSTIYGDVFAWATWLKTTAAQAATEGGYPTPVWATGGSTDPAFNAPVGGSCGAGSSCPGAGTCVDEAAGATLCTRRCDDSAACPSAYACAESNGVKVCLPEPAAKAPSSGSSGCAMRDPTKPVPWGRVILAAGAVALVQRRRARR